MKKVILLIIVLTISTVLFVGCGSSKNTNTPPANTLQKVMKGTVNQTITLPNDTAITVDKVLRNPEDNKMILIEVEIKNVGNAPKVYSPQNFILKDKNGDTYTPAIAKVPGPIITTNVLSGKMLSGYLGFTVPSNENKFTLVYQGATGNIEIMLSIPRE